MVREGSDSFCWFSIFLQLFLNPLSQRDIINQRQNAWLGHISSSIGRIIARLPKKGYDFQEKKQRNKIKTVSGIAACHARSCSLRKWISRARAFMKVLKLNVVSDSLPAEQLGRLILAFQSFLNILGMLDYSWLFIH